MINKFKLLQVYVLQASGVNFLLPTPTAENASQDSLLKNWIS